MKHLWTHLTLALLLTALGTTDSQAKDPKQSDEKSEEATEEFRTEVATKKLTKEQQAISLYVRGLCCPSCAIGVRKKIGKLDFVDKKRFNKGVDLDAEAQLATVALKPGLWPDPSALNTAVSDAGYDLIHYYIMSDGTLKTTAVTPPKK